MPDAVLEKAIGCPVRAQDEAPVDETGPAPVIRREGIHWFGRRGDGPMLVALTFENPGDRPTRAVEAEVARAEFGAFRPWTPIGSVVVPPIPPGASETVFWPPNWPGAIGPAAGLRRPSAPDNLLRPMPSRPVAQLWGGNIGVFTGSGQPVERHCQTLDCLVAGLTTQAWVLIGDGRPDAYLATVARATPGFDVVLQYPGASPGGGVWVEAACIQALVDITPAHDARHGGVDIEVRRGSTGRSVIVEFTLLARAAD